MAEVMIAAKSAKGEWQEKGNSTRGCLRYALGYCDCLTECELRVHPERFVQVVEVVEVQGVAA